MKLIGLIQDCEPQNITDQMMINICIYANNLEHINAALVEDNERYSKIIEALRANMSIHYSDIFKCKVLSVNAIYSDDKNYELLMEEFGDLKEGTDEEH